jgi:EAL domain-containing protein (putative c-di-GMP-specific phosphodiesterase class I)
MGAMQTVYQQKILDVRTNNLYRCEVFFAEQLSTEQAVSALPLGRDGRLFPFKEMINHLIRVTCGLPDDIQHLVSINVANSILVDSDMLEVFFEQLEDMPYGLSVEVTPLDDLPEPRKLNGVFRTLRKLNCSVEFDDFGGSKSQNPEVLSEYAFDSVKLNSKFVRSMLSDGRRMRLLALLIGMIKAQGKLLVATGVSTCEQSEKLASLGIVLQQGDFIHSPEPVS